MHILIVIHGYPPDYNAGSEVYTQSIVNELSKKHKITVFSRVENPFELDFKIHYRKEDENREFYTVNMARSKDGYNHPLLNKQFAEIIDNTKPDIVHIGHLNHLSIGIVDEIKKRNIPILFTLHDFWLMCPRGQFLQRNFDGQNLHSLCDGQEDRKCAVNCYSMYFSNDRSEEYYTYWVKKRMQDIRQIVEKIDLFHAPSRYLMNRFITDFAIPKEKIFYLDYGFPTHYLKPVEPKTNGIFTFGYIGTHIPAKGINLLIEAFKELKGTAKLKIFGRHLGQTTRALEKLAENSPNPVEFCGEYINQNLTTTVFNNVNAIVVPSIWAENSPLVIHEAQACKIPVITGNYGGMAEYVKDNVNGLIFNHRDKDSLRDRMQFAIDNPDYVKKLGQRGYLYSGNGQVPSIEEHCTKLVEIYKSEMRNLESGIRNV